MDNVRNLTQSCDHVQSAESLQATRKKLPISDPSVLCSLTICMATRKATIMLSNEPVIICETHSIFITQDLKSAIFFGF